MAYLYGLHGDMEREIMLAYDFGICSEMYCGNDYPLKRGNYHSIRTEKVPYIDEQRACQRRYNMPAFCYFLYNDTIDGYFVKNMCYENFKELFNRGILSWPVEFRLEYNQAILTDPRIPEEWFGETI